MIIFSVMAIVVTFCLTFWFLNFYKLVVDFKSLNEMHKLYSKVDADIDIIHSHIESQCRDNKGHFHNYNFKVIDEAKFSYRVDGKYYETIMKDCGYMKISLSGKTKVYYLNENPAVMKPWVMNPYEEVLYQLLALLYAAAVLIVTYICCVVHFKI